MGISELLRDRISTRAYLDRRVDESIVYDLLDAARWSPSGGNLQPWKVIAVAGVATDELVRVAKARIAANPAGKIGDRPVYPEKLAEPYRSRRFKIGEDIYARLGIRREDRIARLPWFARNYEFFGAPVILFFIIDGAMCTSSGAHLGNSCSRSRTTWRPACSKHERCCATRCCTRTSRCRRTGSSIAGWRSSTRITARTLTPRARSACRWEILRASSGFLLRESANVIIRPAVLVSTANSEAAGVSREITVK